MELSNKIANMWKARDELSLRNFRLSILPLALVLLLSIIIGDLRYVEQNLVVFGMDSNNIIQVFFGLGFLPIFFAKERHIGMILRVAVFVQTALLILQLFIGPGFPRLFVYSAFHLANGMSTACGFYLFAFALNNVERLFTMLLAQFYFAFAYLFWQIDAVADFFLGAGSVVIMLALITASLFIRSIPEPEKPAVEPTARESGITAIILLSMFYHVITLMTLYIEHQETTVSGALYGIGGMASIAVIFVIMLIFNYSALHLWTLCLVFSVLGLGALHYTPAIAVNSGSLFYGIGEGLGFMIIYYLQGGALKRSGSFRLLRLCCLFTCINYAVVGSIFYAFYSDLSAPNLSLAFPVILMLELVCFLIAPVLHDKLFRTDWTDGYHMSDMPLYVEAYKHIEQLDMVNELCLTPREKEVFTLLLTDASVKQIAGVLKLSENTVKFHSKNLYRKFDIQSRTELMAQYGGREVLFDQQVSM